MFLPEEVSGSGDSYEWHIEGVIKYRHRDDINHIDNIYNKTFSDSGTISVGGVVVRKYFVNPKEQGINLGEGGLIVVMKCYKEGNNTKINVIIIPTEESFQVEIDKRNDGYWGSGNISINNELIIKKVISHKIKHDKLLIVYVENGKKPLKLTIIRKGDTYNITGATRKELENKLL